MPRHWYEESLYAATIIGAFTWPYEFWTLPDTTGRTQVLICKGEFENDEQAVEWFKKYDPFKFSQGVEMRCFNKTP